MSATTPDNLGVVNGKLAKCPDSPNCVSTQAESEGQKMDPISFAGSSEEAMSKIKTVMPETISRTNLVSEKQNYLHYEVTSLIFRFVDDVEFFVDDVNKVIHFRSASRVGHSDMGANKQRMLKITGKLEP